MDGSADKEWYLPPSRRPESHLQKPQGLEWGAPPDSHKLFSSLLDAGRMAQRFRALGIRPHLLTSATHTLNAHTYMQVKHSLRASMLHS